jgi:spoIIIJ-associated protein
VAHAEASARTVEAAVTAAAAQLGLRSDQVDVQVLEDPVPSTFGYVGTPARVRVTPRSSPTAPDVTATASSGSTSQASGPTQGSGFPASTASPEIVAAPSSGSAGSAVPGPGSSSAPDVAAGTASTIAAATPSDLTGSSERSPAGAADSPTSSEPTTVEAPEGAITPSPQDVSEATNVPNGSAPTSASSSEAEPSGTSSAAASTSTGAAPTATEAGTAQAPPRPAASGAEDGQDASPATAPAEGATGGATRSSRRTYRERDEHIAPEIVEEDTERAGDFLEGLLDALDVDGDITTWVDEVGGHIDLEGADLEPLIGSNGETLDSLQELTRLAVLRQSKRRVRLLLDINGFRARQRDQLISIVRTTAEQVLRSREDHEFQPMSPAERKIVHDAVAAIDGVRTESLGEDPNRRVVIRPT